MDSKYFIREQKAKDIIKFCVDSGVWEEKEYSPEDFTCIECTYAEHCIFAFDEYNTYGDCLADK